MPSRSPLRRSRLIQETRTPVASLLRRTGLVAASRSPVRASFTATWQRVACKVPMQEQSNWCWCATTLGVQQYYVGGDSTTQCEAADKILGRADSCANPTGTDVNKPYYLDLALMAFNRLLGAAVASPLPDVQLAHEIQAAKPVGARVGWSGGGGHFMAIVGHLAAPVPRIAISDPIYGESDIDYSLYLSGYQGSGSWTHSYLTQ